ncbi:hypothetical protein [Actinoplanes sp. ATCC 53533]|nr:hypothetical protein [Actinoplanes sp. ATCC 53533]
MPVQPAADRDRDDCPGEHGGGQRAGDGGKPDRAGADDDDRYWSR